MKEFCSLKSTVKRMQRQSTEWEEVSANPIPDKGLVVRVFKDLAKLRTQTDNPMTMDTRSEETF